jgi:hypothetical protein
MAANITPIFVLAGNIKPARIAAANTAADGSGTLVTLITAGASGSRVDGVRFRNSSSIYSRHNRCTGAQNISYLTLLEPMIDL